MPKPLRSRLYCVLLAQMGFKTKKGRLSRPPQIGIRPGGQKGWRSWPDTPQRDRVQANSRDILNIIESYWYISTGATLCYLQSCHTTHLSHHLGPDHRGPLLAQHTSARPRLLHPSGGRIRSCALPTATWSPNPHDLADLERFGSDLGDLGERNFTSGEAQLVDSFEVEKYQQAMKILARWLEMTVVGMSNITKDEGWWSAKKWGDLSKTGQNIPNVLGGDPSDTRQKPKQPWDRGWANIKIDPAFRVRTPNVVG